MKPTGDSRYELVQSLCSRQTFPRATNHQFGLVTAPACLSTPHYILALGIVWSTLPDLVRRSVQNCNDKTRIFASRLCDIAQVDRYATNRAFAGHGTQHVPRDVRNTLECTALRKDGGTGVRLCLRPAAPCTGLQSLLRYFPESASSYPAGGL